VFGSQGYIRGWKIGVGGRKRVEDVVERTVHVMEGGIELADSRFGYIGQIVVNVS
jgi:hypothetical protein